MNVFFLLLIGVATWYGGPAEPVDGNALYCDRGNGLVYSETAEPWVALALPLYNTWAECGDMILITGDGWEIQARALDSGWLHKYRTAEWPEYPILVDFPYHLAPFEGTSLVTIQNLSRPYYGPALTQ